MDSIEYYYIEPDIGQSWLDILFPDCNDVPKTVKDGTAIISLCNYAYSA